MSDVTHILQSMIQGNPQAADQLLPLVYDELRNLARKKMANEKPGQTLDATALVHEAYLRLVDQAGEHPWEGHRHFFAAAAEAMRRILIDNARRKHSLKRGGHLERQHVQSDAFLAPESCDELIALNEALDTLARTDPEVVELVKLRYFAGLTNKQAAELLNISPRTADSWWAYARAWLLTELGRSSE